MRPTGHVHSASLVLVFFYHSISNFQELYALFFLLGVMIVDLDGLYVILFKKRLNHRMFLSHYPGLYLILLFLTYLTNNEVLSWLLVGILYHLVFDTFDWGLPLFPFNKHNIITPHLLQVSQIRSNGEFDFFKVYWSHSTFRYFELFLFAGFLLTVFFLPIEIFLLIVLIDIILMMEIIHNIKKLRHK